MPVNPRFSLRGLRSFCVAARYGSFRTAAEELHITASAVSHQIKNLEEMLGEQLFERGGRELKLSSVGAQLYEDVTPLIEQLDAMVARYKKAPERSSIRISVQPFFASEYFIPRLHDFTATHPTIDIKVGTSDESAERHPGDADLSIRLFRTPPADMRSDLLFPLTMAPAGSPEFQRSMVVKGGKICSDFPIIVHETYPNAWKQWSEAAGIELPDNQKVTRLDSMIAVVRAAQRGIGAALVPIPIGNLWFEEGSVVRLFDKELVANVSYYLVGPEGDASLERFRSWILQTFVTAR
ncbi:LysR family transcriptional regulator [Thioalkalivibrio sp. XN279]|uniref:LysR family transcriptional regulator n=1 Tax=Thioalkalivibrio sp. XN279 TaxID=2714953 RepID=UPI00140777E2|nr:LysR family transcriptional regulator [Thioalkalivibrio sp. XN279]NHA13657.1 LysR family transcriptional regulator [Thioalkalivibrio sp. XN279]